MEPHELRARHPSGFAFRATWSPVAFKVRRARLGLQVDDIREELVKRIGDRAPSRSALGRWNSGDSTGPRSYELLAEVASILGCAPGDLYRPQPSTLDDLPSIELP